MQQTIDPDMPSIQQGEYIHTKSGKHYEVLGVAMQTETQEPLVIYRPLYDTKYEFFARPFAMFVENIELQGSSVPRFQKVEL